MVGVVVYGLGSVDVFVAFYRNYTNGRKINRTWTVQHDWLALVSEGRDKMVISIVITWQYTALESVYYGSFKLGNVWNLYQTDVRKTDAWRRARSMPKGVMFWDRDLFNLSLPRYGRD